jgi:hypothetical protein
MWCRLVSLHPMRWQLEYNIIHHTLLSVSFFNSNKAYNSLLGNLS